MSVLSEATRISTEHREIFLACLDLMSEQTEFLRPNMFNYNQLIVGITTEGDVLTVNDPFPNLDLPVYELSKSRKKGKEAVAVMEKACKKYGYNFDAFAGYISSISEKQDEKGQENLYELVNYFRNNWDCIVERMNGTHCGSCTEPLISHTLSERLSRNPLAWSKEGLSKIAML